MANNIFELKELKSFKNISYELRKNLQLFHVSEKNTLTKSTN